MDQATKGIPCPKCGKVDSWVFKTRVRVGIVRRIRKCHACGEYFNTTEEAAPAELIAWLRARADQHYQNAQEPGLHITEHVQEIAQSEAYRQVIERLLPADS